ncbi:cytidine deaminase, partial [Phenoliferia sp. Uapishka_3]
MSPLLITPEQRETLIQKSLAGLSSLVRPFLYLELTPGSRCTAREGSYSPYSHFRVGACLLAEDGSFVMGANVENASYEEKGQSTGRGLGDKLLPPVQSETEDNDKKRSRRPPFFAGGAICAERTAVVKGVSEMKRKFIGLAVSSDIKGPISPCGICRQVLREFCPLNASLRTPYVQPLSMPILLVPSQYSEKTITVSLKEMNDVKTEDKLVETSMEEVKLLPFVIFRSDAEIEATTLSQILPFSFGPEDLERPQSSS